MALFHRLRKVSFAGITFPTQSVRIAGGIRDHIHEYPHLAGGAPEKMGRKLYEITIVADFESALKDPAYSDLWQRLGQLRQLWEAELTRPLVLPTIGTIDAYARGWVQSSSSKNLSGEEADITLVEDQASAFLTDAILKAKTGALEDQVAAWTIAQAGVHPRPSIFDRITNAANAVLAVKDQIDLYGSLVESKILGLTSLLNEADRDVQELNEPKALDLIDAFLGLWKAANDLHNDLEARGFDLVQYVVPVTMTVAQISASVFGGDASRGTDIMGLNPLDDPLRVLAGTVIRYYGRA